jgi:hypothetical protein
MKIMFKQDFRGKVTNELPYKAGDILDVDEPAFEYLVSRGHAVAMDEPADPPASAEVVDPDSKPKGGGRGAKK